MSGTGAFYTVDIQEYYSTHRLWKRRLICVTSAHGYLTIPSHYLASRCGDSCVETVDELITGALVDHEWWSYEKPITVASSILPS
jgi:hypothetical protein